MKNKKNNKVKVLDKGFIRLIDLMGNDMSIINAARISYQKHFKHNKLTKKDEELLKFLANNKHWTPFSQTAIQLHIKMPIFIARQWFKTQVGFTRNELSRRYTKNDPEFYLPMQLNYTPKISKTLSTNGYIQNNYLINDMDLQYQKSIHLYNKLLDEGVLPEQARIVLPAALYTEFIETSSLIGYAKIYHLQINHQAQVEIQQYAKAIDKLLIQYFPYSWQALKTYYLND